MKPDHDYAMYVAQTPVMNAAWAFAVAYWIDRDMRAAWRVTHPTLRRCWTQAWLSPLLAHGRVDGHPEAVVEAFAEDEVRHEFWEPFAHAQVSRSTPLALDREAWGMQANPDLVAPYMMLVRLVSTAPTGAGRSDEPCSSVPLLMQYDAGPGWRLLNFASERMPVPGWRPPRFGEV
ncbi:hypothetical protein [Streptomyces sp. L2]|uniref:hypothetical protein n=1 Tax=Streptomyces sp. L2 TaxID=2162665 RepID=UPI0010115875|nr:hypothetical protein [Streptomyces sp. L2]